MRIIRAKVMGYCMGVRRAVEAAENALSQGEPRHVWSLGPLIHNPAALKSLEARGLKVLGQEGIGSLGRGDAVLIRAHGIPPSLRKELEDSGCEVIDATCPRVLLSQRRAREYSEKGYAVYLAGDRNHGEVAGIAGCAPDCRVIAGSGEAERVSVEQGRKAVLLSQTTISCGEYDAICAALSARISGLEVLDTICPATTERQAALREMAAEADGILVIGGRGSANNRRLFSAAQSLCKTCALVEGAGEIPKDFFSLDTVGLTAGASTPDFVIDEVEAFLRKFSGAYAPENC